MFSSWFLREWEDSWDQGRCLTWRLCTVVSYFSNALGVKSWILLYFHYCSHTNLRMGNSESGSKKIVVKDFDEKFQDSYVGIPSSNQQNGEVGMLFSYTVIWNSMNSNMSEMIKKFFVPLTTVESRLFRRPLTKFAIFLSETLNSTNRQRKENSVEKGKFVSCWIIEN